VFVVIPVAIPNLIWKLGLCGEFNKNVLAILFVKLMYCFREY